MFVSSCRLHAGAMAHEASSHTPSLHYLPSCPLPHLFLGYKLATILFFVWHCETGTFLLPAGFLFFLSVLFYFLSAFLRLYFFFSCLFLPLVFKYLFSSRLCKRVDPTVLSIFSLSPSPEYSVCACVYVKDGDNEKVITFVKQP